MALLGPVLLGVGCSGDESGDGDRDRSAEPAEEARPPPGVFPGETWAQGDPAELGFDPAALDRIAADAQAIGSACLLVVRHGQIAGEWYWNGTDAATTHQVWSVTKSYTSTLVGIAQDDGLLDIDEIASDYIPAWVGTPSEYVTIRHILSNTSGRRSTAGGTETALANDFFGTDDRTAFAIGLDLVEPPHTVWSNNEAAIQTLDAVLETATGQDPATYARDRLLGPIGARHTEMTRDRAGNTNMPAFLQTTCQDAARFGHLFLHQGNWDGTQVVSEDWVSEATQPSQNVYGGYGHLWWLNTRHHGLTETLAQQLGGVDPDQRQSMPDAPERMYWALGAFGQVIQIDPGSGTVVVRFGAGTNVYDATARDTTARIVTEALQAER